MVLVRRLARPLLASTFISGGWDALRHPDSKTPAADRVVAPLVPRVPGISTTEQLVRLDAGVKVAAGVALALGKFPRLSSLALAASLVPTTLAGHAFWQERDPLKRRQQRLHFYKNASMLGGLLIAAVDTEGRPSLAWRAKRGAAELQASAVAAGHDAAASLQSANEAVRSKLG